MNHFNNLTPAEDERLTLLTEECAEVIIAIAKIQRHGYESFDPTEEAPDSNRSTLAKEMGDVRAAMIMLCNAGDVSKENMHRHADNKLINVKQWLHHQGKVE